MSYALKVAGEVVDVVKTLSFDIQEIPQRTRQWIEEFLKQRSDGDG